MAPLRCADLFARMFFYTSKCVFTIRNPRYLRHLRHLREQLSKLFRKFNDAEDNARAIHLASDITAMIQQIYSDQLFIIRDGDHESSQRHQSCGIVQICALTHFLFIIAMNMLMQDKQIEMIEQYPHLNNEYRLSNILYADDIIIIHDEINIAQFHINCIRCISKITWSSIK